MGFWSPQRQKSGGSVLAVALDGDTLNFLVFRQMADKKQVLKYGNQQVTAGGLQESLGQVIAQLPREVSVGTLIATFSPDHFKAKSIEIVFPGRGARHVLDKKEALWIEKTMRQQAKAKLFGNLFGESGILPADFRMLRLVPTSQKIDGYSVPRLEGFKAGEIRASFLATFLLATTFFDLAEFVESKKLHTVRVRHMAEAIADFGRKTNREGVYLYVGRRRSQLVVWKQGVLLLPETSLALGEEDFVEVFGEVLGMRDNIAFEFEKRYVEGALSTQVKEKIDSLLLPTFQKFVTLIKKQLEVMKTPLPGNIWIFGRGIKTHHFQEVLQAQLAKGLPFTEDINVHILAPKDIWEGVSFAQNHNPQYSSLCLVADSVLVA